MKYTKPEVLMDGEMAEGVYAASGSASCDCFRIEGIMSRTRASYFACNYEVHYNEGASHMDGASCWNQLKVIIEFNQAVPAGATINPTHGTVSGNTITYVNTGVTPAVTGNLSYNFVEVKGDGAENLTIKSITATH